MTANGKVTVHKGIVNVEPSVCRWKILGTTCCTTIRPGTGYVKNSFKFFPTNTKGEDSEDLVFAEACICDLPSYSLFHIKRRADGYVRVTENPSDAKDLVGASVNFQVISATGSIELQVGKTRFTSDTTAIAAEDELVMVADTSDILKFIAGHIKIRELKAAAKRAQKHIGLLQVLKEAKIERDAAQVEGRRKDRRIENLNAEMAGLRSQLAALAEQG